MVLVCGHKVTMGDLVGSGLFGRRMIARAQEALSRFRPESGCEFSIGLLTLTQRKEYLYRIHDKDTLSFVRETTHLLFVHVPSSMHACARCGETNREMSECSRCRCVRYCGDECQHVHWASHKSWCKHASLLEDGPSIRDRNDYVRVGKGKRKRHSNKG